jgi:hypothetical protein
MRDWFEKPVVQEINTDGYHGAIGNPILIRAHDDVKVVSVQVVIRLSNGTMVEKGEAVTLSDYTWNYVATAATPEGAPLIIEATARDWAGNTAVKNVNLP